MRTTCHACGQSWGGLSTSHCTACHETFTSNSVGDQHRVGSFADLDGPDARRCLTPDEMRAKKWVRREAGWGGAELSDEQKSKMWKKEEASP